MFVRWGRLSREMLSFNESFAFLLSWISQSKTWHTDKLWSGNHKTDSEIRPNESQEKYWFSWHKNKIWKTAYEYLLLNTGAAILPLDLKFHWYLKYVKCRLFLGPGQSLIKWERKPKLVCKRTTPGLSQLAATPAETWLENWKQLSAMSEETS